MNHEELEDEQKVAYLLRQTKGKVFDIEDIADPYKLLTIRGRVLYPSWKNVLYYYTFDQEMILKELEEFINDNADLLLSDEYPTENGASFASDIVYGSYLKIAVYEKMLPVLFQHVIKDDEIKLTKKTGSDRIELLINKKCLSDKVKTAQIVSEYGSTLFAKYLSLHINSILVNYDEYDIDPKTLTILLDKNSALSPSQRWNLSKKVSVDLIKADSELANEIVLIMLKKRGELSWAVVEATLKNANYCDEKKKLQLWLIQRYKDDETKVRAIIETMKWPYYEIVDDSKRPVVPVEFKDYLDLIQPLGIFSSYKKDKKGLRVYHSTRQ